MAHLQWEVLNHKKFKTLVTSSPSQPLFVSIYVTIENVLEFQVIQMKFINQIRIAKYKIIWQIDNKKVLYSLKFEQTSGYITQKYIGIVIHFS